ncbi:hypothetical protein [Pedobacter metabolipauper]|uniref:YD repeat-containing protein n=1 Tax=Pedobacter metabolipauper TaxID=425513 RepID=A0A4R6T2I7_9SPHI|nr:hypothetical protein [Pedobacter metabolipauper]TDQ11561.1 hypothetical protein ATK78_0684 [Pedobacter metabolipauper]
MIQKIKNILILSVALICISNVTELSAQALKRSELYKINQVPPNAASLGKFGEHPVGFYTGTPSINIPIYELNIGRIKLPIGLSYHAGGIKVEEMASSVGLGWALNSGGVITRSIKGMPDEITPPGGMSFLTTNVTVDSMLNKINNSSQGPAVNTMLKSIVGSHLDAQADIFYFNFGSFSGKFMYDQKQAKFLSIPYTKLKIEFNYQSESLSSFTITDENGLVYSFGDQEFSTRGENQSLTTANSWYLTSIFDPASNVYVTFNYETFNVTYATLSTDVHYKGLAFQASAESKQDTYHTLKRLKNIISNQGQILFNYALSRCDVLGDLGLTSIKVLNTDNNVTKDIRLNYDYFYAPGYNAGNLNCNNSLDALNRRLKLLSVDEYPSIGSSSTPLSHRIDYSDITLPSRLSRSQDHWGYFNGQPNLYLYPPLNFSGPYTNEQLPGGNREASPSSSQAGIIQKLTYPTGGYTTFEFENNTSNSLNAPMPSKADGVSLAIESNYSEINFTLLSTCSTSNGSYVTLSKSGLETIEVPSGFPGIVAQIKLVNTDTNVEDILFQLGGDKDVGSMEPNTFLLPNGNYKLILDCTTNPYSSSYAIFQATMIWPECYNLAEVENTNKNVGGLRIYKIKNFDSNNTIIGTKTYKYNKEDNPLLTSGESHFYPTYIRGIGYTENLNAQTILPCIKRYAQSTYPLVSENGKGVGYSNVIELNGEDDSNGYTQYKYTNFSQYDDEQHSDYEVSEPVSFQWLRGLELEKKIFKKNGSQNELVYSMNSEYNTDLIVRKTVKGIRGVYMYDGSPVEMPGEDMSFLGAVYAGWEEYPTYSDFVHLKKTTEKTYTGTSFVENIKTYTYNDRNLMPSIIETRSSDGKIMASVIKYPTDYTVTGATNLKSTSIRNLLELNFISPVIEEFTYKTLANESKLLTAANYYSYRSDLPLVDTVFSLNLPSSPILNYQGIQANATTFSKNTNYRPEIIFEKYNTAFINNNLVQQKRFAGQSESIIWDYAAAYPIAKALNAVYEDIAYTSFEAEGKGNWNYTGVPILSTAASGNKVYQLTSGSMNKSGLTSGRKYIVSYKTQNATPFAISGTVGSAVSGTLTNGWYHFTHQVTGVTSVQLSGSGIIDDVQLFPADAQMTTYTYTPLLGMTSMTDAKGLTTYYEYDEFQRLKSIKDQNLNVIKSYTYHYKP